MAHADLPSGTVTFLFTDIEGSTRRWEHDTAAMHAAVQRHFALLDEAIVANHGARFKTIGDAVQAAFPTAPDGVAAAVAAQRLLAAEGWGELGPIRVRMALHTGAAAPLDGDYLAPCLNRLARLLATGFGDQILLSEATTRLVRDTLPAGVRCRDLGDHRLRDLLEPERVFQVVAPGLASEFPPLKSLDRATHNLPTQPTPLIGREREVAAAARLLGEEAVRLLTLTGPGGVGKTRLALDVAAELAAGFADGVWLVDLAAVADPALVAPTIVAALGLRVVGAEPVADALRDYLRPRRVLLVLDNFERVVAAAPLVADLLAACPALEVLVTSRAPLRIAGEHEFAVPPLGLPREAGGETAEAVLTSEAGRLFVDRARAVRADFALTDEGAPAVAEIVRRLDGLPLAIELAAARVRLMPPPAILARLENRLGLLTGGGRDRPARQQTLRATIAWSHDLLDPAEQALFRRLAVFADGWTIEAAEAVAAGDPSGDLLEGLGGLNDNSLIRLREEAGGGPDEPRFAMLQTVREFALERLAASGEEPVSREAHADSFLHLAAEAEPHLSGPEAVAWLGRLDADLANLRAALDWFVERREGERAVGMGAALWRYWWLRGHLTEGRRRLDAVLAVGTGQATARARATALDGAGVLAEVQGDYDRAATLHETALAISRGLGDDVGTARALGNLGVVAGDRGDDERAARLLDEALLLARRIGDERLVATTLNDLARVAEVGGDRERAEALYRESLDLRRGVGSPSDVAVSLNNLGAISADRGDLGGAHALFEESLALYRDAGDAWGTANTLNSLAGTAVRRGNIAEALPLYQESLRLFQETGDARSGAVVRLNLAEVARAAGGAAHAAALLAEALPVFRTLDDRDGIAGCLACLGGLAGDAGRLDVAARLLAAAAVPDAAAGAAAGLADAARFEADIAAIRAAMGEAAFDAGWHAGRQPDEAMADGLAVARELARGAGGASPEG